MTQTLLITIALAALGGQSLAMQDGEKQPQQAPDAKRQNTAHETSPLERLSKLHGMTVATPRGEKLGKIEDVLIDVGTPAIAFVVVAFDASVGHNGKFCAVPWCSFSDTTPRPTADSLVLDLDKDRLRNAPCFEKDAWPNMGAVTWAVDVHKYFGQTPYWEERAMRGQMHDASGEPKRETPLEDAAKATSVKLDLRRGSTLIGLAVKNLKDEKLGTLDDIVVVPKRNPIVYAVLASGGFLGLGEKLFAIPFRSFRFAAGGGDAVLDVDKEGLKDAPGFDKRSWPMNADEKFTSDVNRYWDRAKAATPPSDRPKG